MQNTKNSVYVIRHLPTKTYYGIYQSPSKSMYPHHSNHKRQSIVCFQKFSHALKVGDSISTYMNIYNDNPSMDKLCVFSDKSIINDALETDLFIAQVDVNEFIKETRTRNLGMFIIEDIVETTDKIVVDGKELVYSTFEHLSNSTDFQSILESDLNL